MKIITLSGTLGKDAVLRRTQAGEPVLGFSMAVDDGYGDNKSIMWFDINVWGKRAQALEPHLKKGMRVTVNGEFGARQHENKTYFTCRASDIAMQGGGERQSAPAQQERDSYGNAPANFGDVDDIPFAMEWR